MIDSMWILTGIIGLGLILVTFLIALKRRKSGLKAEPDYKMFLYMGLAWIIADIIFSIPRGLDLDGLFMLGIIFVAIGVAKRGG
jgi:hypothetical protein